jgi:hypothetical protein
MQVQTLMEGFTVGCDPEIFVLDPDGRPVCAEMIPGTKAAPHEVPFGAVQRDGFAAEFNIQPAKTFEEFDHNITSVVKSLKEFLPKGHTLSFTPSVVFDEDVFINAPEDAQELGCSPDFNAWTGEVNPPPHDPENPYLRTASGHLHYGWTDGASLSDLQHVLNCRDLVKQLDWYLGGWSLKMDEDSTRRRLYGKAGSCRYKPYGVEYRVLSNFWLTTKTRRLAVWNRGAQAISDMRGLYMPDSAKRYNDVLIQSINSSQRQMLFEKQFRFPLSTLDKMFA